MTTLELPRPVESATTVPLNELFENYGNNITRSLLNQHFTIEELMPVGIIFTNPLNAAIEGVAFDAKGSLTSRSEYQVNEIRKALQINQDRTPVMSYIDVVKIGIANRSRNWRRKKNDPYARDIENWANTGGPLPTTFGDAIRTALTELESRVTDTTQLDRDFYNTDAQILLDKVLQDKAEKTLKIGSFAANVAGTQQ